MQIIIVQHEIESAVKAYVLSQLNVKDGHRIDVSFAATRGEDGLKATIDIVSNDQMPATTAVVETTEEEPAAPVVQQATPTRRARLVSPARKVEHTEEAQEQHEEGAAATDVVSDTKGDPEANPETGEATEQEEEPAPVTSGRSLFSNLRKPTNS